MSTSAPAPRRYSGRRGRHSNTTLAILASWTLITVLDISIVTIALPSIQRGLGFSAEGLSWVQNAYVLAFGGLLLLGGRAGDIVGKRRMFILGAAVFAVASLLGGLAESAAWLVAARALQGVGAAAAGPNALALILANFEDGPPRSRALGVYAAVAGSGMALGLILGGLLTSAGSWRWVMFVTVPFAIGIAVLGPVFLREPDPRPGRIGVAGGLTATGGMTALVYGFISVESGGWTAPVTLSVFGAAVVLLGLFVLIQARSADPIMPLRLFADRNRAGGYLAMLLVPATNFGMFFFLTLFMQDILGFSPLEAGLAFLPFALVLVVASRVVPRLVPRYGARALLLAGGMFTTAGMGWLSRLTADGGYVVDILGPSLLVAVGVGLIFMPLTALILSSVAPEDGGVASGALQTMQQVGGSLGLAILITVFGAASTDQPVESTAADRATAALASGIGDALLASSAFAVAVVLVAAFWLTPARTTP